MDIRAIVAANVRTMRARTGLSQEALADAARIDRTYVSGIERGVRNPTVLVLQRLAVALDVDVAEIVTRPTPTRKRS